jgi:hypothetical protein
MTHIANTAASGKRAQSSSTSNRIWRGKFAKLCKRRFKTHYLPDDSEGRALLLVLLRLGLSAEAAIEDAPWCAAELAALQRAAGRVKWQDIGKLIGLLDAERDACKLWQWWPIDVPKEEVQRRAIERRKQADRERKQRKRERNRQERETIKMSDERAEAIMRLLPYIEAGKNFSGPGANADRAQAPWLPVSVLIKETIKCKAFRRPDGARLRNVRDAVHRALRRLASLGVIETALRPGPRGSVLYVRNNCAAAAPQAEVPGKADAFCDGRSVAPGRDAGNARRTRVSQVKRTKKKASALVREASGHVSISSHPPTSGAAAGLAKEANRQWWDDDDPPPGARFH